MQDGNDRQQPQQRKVVYLSLLPWVSLYFTCSTYQERTEAEYEA